MQIQISWLLKKPTDLDLHCLQRPNISGFRRTRVKSPSSVSDSKQESLLAKLNDINSEQTERINVLADENTLLKETVSKLKAQLDQLSDAPGRVAEEETRGKKIIL